MSDNQFCIFCGEPGELIVLGRGHMQCADDTRCRFNVSHRIIGEGVKHLHDRIRDLEVRNLKLTHVLKVAEEVAETAQQHVEYAKSKEDCGPCLEFCPNAIDGELDCECGGSGMVFAVAAWRKAGEETK